MLLNTILPSQDSPHAQWVCNGCLWGRTNKSKDLSLHWEVILCFASGMCSSRRVSYLTILLVSLNQRCLFEKNLIPPSFPGSQATLEDTLDFLSPEQRCSLCELAGMHQLSPYVPARSNREMKVIGVMFNSPC